METLDDRFNRGQEMRVRMAGGNPSHYALPGIDQLAPDLSASWTSRSGGPYGPGPELDTESRSFVTIAALTALGQMPAAPAQHRARFERGRYPRPDRGGCHPDDLSGGYPSVESAMKLTKGHIRGAGNRVLSHPGLRHHPYRGRTAPERPAHLRRADGGTAPVPGGGPRVPGVRGPEVHRGIPLGRHSRPSRAGPQEPGHSAACRHDRAGAVRPADPEADRGGALCGRDLSGDHGGLFQLVFYGSYTNSRTAMRVARSVFIEQGLMPAPAD